MPALTTVTPSNEPEAPALAAVAPVTPVRTVAEVPSTQPAGSTSYTIKSGETLSTIAAHVYGNSRFYVAIMRANPKLDANHLRPGTRITLPDISDVKPGAAQLARETQSPDSTGKTYTVKSGDTLYRISKSLYGTGRRADSIYEMNKESIGPDKSHLKLGLILRLPASPTVSGATASTR